jgi:hypothetical protein
MWNRFKKSEESRMLVMHMSKEWMLSKDKQYKPVDFIDTAKSIHYDRIIKHNK